MRPIPPKLRNEMEIDPYYQRCCVTGKSRSQMVKIEWHHNLIYAGRQVNEKWCILPLWDKIHDQARNKEVKEILDWIMLNRATDGDLARYSKADLIAKKERLNKDSKLWMKKMKSMGTF